MEKGKETITISIHDFRSIIAEEVRKTLQSNVSKNNPRYLFTGINNHSLVDINKKYQISNKEEWVNNTSGEKLWLHENDGILNIREFRESNFNNSSRDLHEQIRMLTLMIFGVRKNNDLDIKEYVEAQETYRKINDLAHELYEERLKNLDSKGIKIK